jgi:hypothetical protein
VTTLQAQVVTLQGQNTALQNTINSANTKNAFALGQFVTVDTTDTINGLAAPHIIFAAPICTCATARDPPTTGRRAYRSVQSRARCLWRRSARCGRSHPPDANQFEGEGSSRIPVSLAVYGEVTGKCEGSLAGALQKNARTFLIPQPWRMSSERAGNQS